MLTRVFQYYTSKPCVCLLIHNKANLNFTEELQQNGMKLGNNAVSASTSALFSLNSNFIVCENLTTSSCLLLSCCEPNN